MEGSLGWALDCWPYGKMMSAKDSDPDCVKLDPDCVGTDPDSVSAELAGQEAPGGGQGSLGRHLESLGGVAMEAGRLRRPAQRGGGAWRLLGVSRRLERQVGR